MKAVIKRNNSDDKQTLGKLHLMEDGITVFQCNTLELPWKNNETKVSCIPAGKYKVSPRSANASSKFKYPHFILENTLPRVGILIHAGNYYTQIEGCILVGSGLADINGDGYLDVTNSRATLQKLVELAPNGFDLTIEWENKDEKYN